MNYSGQELQAMNDSELESLSDLITKHGAILKNSRADGSSGKAVYSIYRASDGGVYVKTIPLLNNPSRIILDSDNIVVTL